VDPAGIAAVCTAVLLPLGLVGGFAGIRTMRRLPQKSFDILALILAAAGGLKLFFW